jgi:hypothetical protein
LHDTVVKLEDAVLDALAREEPIPPRALQLLLRRYQSGERDDIGEVVGGALAAALDAHLTDAAVPARVAWLELFVEASTLSDDERLPLVIERLIADLRHGWAASKLDERVAAIGACLYAARLPEFQSIAADAVDELERAVGRAYEPGEVFGSTADQVRAASTLLTAYSVSGRLPYSMLAEELIQSARREPVADFELACEAARVLCRLAILHDDADYRAAAVTAPGADYRADARRQLEPHAADALRRGAAGAIYAIAQLELESALHNVKSDSEM